MTPDGAESVNNKECRFGARRVSAGKTPGGKMEASRRELCKRGTQLALGTCTRTRLYLPMQMRDYGL